MRAGGAKLSARSQPKECHHELLLRRPPLPPRGSPAPPARHSPPTAPRPLAGQWVTQGDVNAGFIKVRVDNRDSYNADGSFMAIRRFVNLEGRWETQTASGKWSVKPGDNADQCVIERLNTGAFGSMSSRSSTVYLLGGIFLSLPGLSAARK